MAYYRRCRTCKHKGGCEIKDALSKAIRGLGITSLLHACDSYESEYRFGQCVDVSTWILEADGLGNPDPLRVVFPGWFVNWTKGGKALTYVRPGSEELNETRIKFDPEGDGWCKIPLARIAHNARCEPCPVCPECSMVPAGGCANVPPDSYWETRNRIEGECPMLAKGESK